jgi:RNA polymerase sigma factor (sigma-70 family)
MTTTPMRNVLRHLRKAALGPDGGSLTDGQLLQRFLTWRDEAAFAILVRRHGPMVMGVCRRILRNSHDADDAFQATFLVLVRKAASLAARAIVGNWLHGVAYRTALKARSADARRRVKERAMSRPEALEEDLRPEWHALLDRELNGLPEKYRAPVILCDLEGKTRREAARLLSWPEGTLSGRLSRARALLARRLANNGMPLVGGSVTVGTAASVPACLAASTVKAAALVAAGQAATAGVFSAKVVALSEGVLKAMLLTKLRAVTAVVVAVSLLGLGAAAGLYPSRAGEPPAEAADPGAIPPEARATVPSMPRARPALGPLPQPAYVSPQGDQAIAVTWEVTSYAARPRTDVARRTTTYFYEPVTSFITRVFSREAVKVFDTGGRKIEGKKLKRLLGDQILAVVMFGDQHVQVDEQNLPQYLSLFKDSTLLVVLPSPAHPPVVPPAPGLPAPVPLAPALAAPPIAVEPEPLPPVPRPAELAAPPLPPPVSVEYQLPVPTTLRVNSKRFVLHYETASSEPPGISAVELWYTRDRRSWQQYAVQNSARSLSE